MAPGRRVVTRTGRSPMTASESLTGVIDAHIQNAKLS
jgi:hypothetical protein